jgi:PPM family protein phosphatase
MCTVSYAGRSDIGQQRSSNQDRWLVDVEQCLYMVADGVGGSSDGALAAQLVIELLPVYLQRRLEPDVDDAADQLRRAVGGLSDDLHAQGRSDPRIAGATSTVVAAVITGSQALISHLGDSRAYLFRDHKLDQLTTDHSLVQALIDAGEVAIEDAKKHPARLVVTRFVAMNPPALPDVTTVDLHDGDRILICSDGLHGVVAGPNLAQILGAHGDPAEACDALIKAANDAGGPDNITAVVIDIPARAPGL